MELVAGVAGGVFALWIFSGAVMMGMKLWHRDVPDIIRTMFHELKPFYLPAVLVHYGYFFVTDGPDMWLNFSFMCSVLGYYLYRNEDKDDDDRWKRRREKVTGVVRRVGAKLVVEPAGVS